MDGGYADESFYALPGFIRCGIAYSGVQMTWKADTDFQFTFETEHDVPVDGYLKIGLPVEMAMPQRLVDSQ